MNKSGNFRGSQIFIDHILRAKRCSRRLGGPGEAGARGERAGGGPARSHQERWAIRAVERTDLGNGTGRSAGGALLNGVVGKVRCRPSRAGTPVAAWGGGTVLVATGCPETIRAGDQR